MHVSKNNVKRKQQLQQQTHGSMNPYSVSIMTHMGVLQKPIADLNNLSANVLKLAVTMRAANTFEQIARFFRPEIFSAKNFSAENFSAENFSAEKVSSEKISAERFFG